jgi:hypothetical protein
LGQCAQGYNGGGFIETGGLAWRGHLGALSGEVEVVNLMSEAASH